MHEFFHVFVDFRKGKVGLTVIRGRRLECAAAIAFFSAAFLCSVVFFDVTVPFEETGFFTAKVVIDAELAVVALDKDYVLEPIEGVEMVREASPG